jgi:ankyrin repeat protein
MNWLVRVFGACYGTCVDPATRVARVSPYRLPNSDLRRHRHNVGIAVLDGFSCIATMDVKKKYEIEAALATEAQAISAGQLKEENPLDLSDDFRAFCEACRRGDLKVCQEKISEGVNINARDKFDYTPLILVGRLAPMLYTTY